MLSRNRFPIVVLWTLVATLVVANNAMAYVGPGAGMEFIAYAIGLLAMVGMAFFSILMWPFYTVLRWIRGTKTIAVSDPPPSSEAAVPNPAPPPATPESNSTPPPSPPAP